MQSNLQCNYGNYPPHTAKIETKINADKMHPPIVLFSVSSPLFTFFIIETVLPYSNITAITEP